MTTVTPAEPDITEKRRRLLQKMMRDAGITTELPDRIPRRNTDSPPPLSFAQQRLWFLDRMMPGNPFYNIDIAIPIRGQVDARVVERTINEIVRRHETLRTRFEEIDGQPVQVIAPMQFIPLERVDLQHLAVEERPIEAERLAQRETQRQFDLAVGPLLYAKLVTSAPDDHLLLLTLHHIVADGWSLRILSRELQTIYTAYAQGRNPDLAELPIQYADFAVWQRNYLSGTVLAKLLDYWRRQLANLPQLVLPADKLRPAIPSYEGAFVSRTLPKQLSKRVKQLSTEQGATPFMVLLAAFALLLSRYSGQEDIVVGSPIASRTRQELENLIGFFVNTLVLRIDLGGNPTFREAISRTRSVVLEALANQDLPFERLVEELQPERELGRNPLFQTIFQVFTPPGHEAGDAGVSTKTPEIQRGTSKFDLRFDLWDTPEGYQGQLEYSTDLFEHATIERLARHFCELLADAVAYPQWAISELNMLSNEERHQILEVWNNTACDYPRQIGVHKLFEIQAAHTPDEAAVVYEDQTLSYRQLDEAANVVAARLQSLGVERDCLVGVFLERSVSMIVAWLGVLKAGGAYVPLDITYPPARLAMMVEDAQAPVVITTVALASRLPETQTKTLLIDDDALCSGAYAGSFQSIDVGGDTLAYVMYTSGSTGQPKGVCIPHKAINRLVINTNYIAFQPGDRFGQISNAAFDAATFEVWGALLNGGRLVGFPREVVLSPHELAMALHRERIDHIFLTTALFNRTVQEAPSAFSALKTLIVGGSKLDPKHIRACLASGPPRRLLNGYGPTESTTFAAYYEVSDVAPAAGSIPIGGPLANTTLYVLDRRHRLQPIGVPGELFIGGEGLASGYFRQPELTTERFVANPFADGERLYATGDRARWLPGGVIDYLGRFDDQTKVRGFRVEPGEIAAILARHEAIQDAAVLIRDEANGEQRIVAYVVVEPEYGVALKEKGREEESRALVEQWQTLYDRVIYRGLGESDPVDPMFNLSGWVDTATGAPIPVGEMQEQIEQTVTRIAARNGERVLEIGCGAGLLLFRLASKARLYVGTDFSAKALDFVRQYLGPADQFPQVTLHQLSATDTGGFEANSFDTVVLNSVVQYFPGIDYFLKVLAQAIQVTMPGGTIFLGDLRNLALLETFHSEVELTRAAGSQQLATVRDSLLKRVDEEQELLLDPAFFSTLSDRFPEIGEVEIQLKRGDGRNELTKYRYDVILRLQSPVQEPIEPDERYWGRDVESLAALRRLLSSHEFPALRVREITNARIVAEVMARDMLEQTKGLVTVADLKQAVAAASGIDPEALWTLGDELPYEVRLNWGAGSGRAGTLEALFVHRRLAGRAVRSAALRATLHAAPIEAFASDPLRGRFIRNLVPTLQSYLRAHLPDYMHPASYVRLSALPLTPNGKIDRAALPAPEHSRPAISRSYLAPRSEVEWRLAEIWGAVLNIDAPGIYDEFFTELGGHSLLATQVVSRIRSVFGVDLPLRVMFETPTIAAIADRIDEILAQHGRTGLMTAPITRHQDSVDVESMSDENVEAALDALLRGGQGESI